MTPEQINREIAKACGIPMPFHKSNDPERKELFDNKRKAIPDYYHSIDAQREVLKILTDEQWLDYMRHLTDPYAVIHNWWTMRRALEATAPQCAEAIVKALGKRAE